MERRNSWAEKRKSVKSELLMKKMVSMIFDKEKTRHFLIINKINLQR